MKLTEWEYYEDVSDALSWRFKRLLQSKTGRGYEASNQNKTESFVSESIYIYINSFKLSGRYLSQFFSGLTES